MNFLRSKSQIQKPILGIGLLLLTSAATDFEAKEAQFCNSIDKLRAEAIRTGEPQRVSTQAIDEIAFVCGQTEKIKQASGFCDEALSIASLEYPHRFPWMIYDCILPDANTLGIKTANEFTGWTGRRKINHLWASWSDGTSIDINFEPTGDNGDQPKFKNYFGQYEIVIWKP